MTLQIFWPKPGNRREGGQKGGTNGREGGEGGSRAKPGNQLVLLYFNSYYYGCGVRSLTGYSRILISEKE